MSPSEASPWELTPVQNLIRYRPSGTYFARFKVGRRLIRQSLQTTVFSVAKQRLPDNIREYRSRYESAQAFSSGKIAVKDAAQVYRDKLATNATLKPNSKRYYGALLDFIEKSWPALFETDVRKVSERDCEKWVSEYQRRDAPTVVNNSIAVLRDVFQEAVNIGARFNNPTAGLERVRVRGKQLELPSRSNFLRFVEEITSAGARQSKDCANLVQFLAFSGLRIGEAKFATWGDVDFSRRQLHVRGDPQTATKNGETRFVPLIPELESLLKRLRAERPDDAANHPVMRVFECQNSMNHAAEKIGLKHLTHHDLRHLFATICIESGVYVPTVSRWLGTKTAAFCA